MSGKRGAPRAPRDVDSQSRAGGPGFAVEMVRVADLKPHPRNYRKHPPGQLAHILKGISEHGIYKNVVVSRDNVVLAGHGVTEAATMAGIEQIPVFRLAVDHGDPRALRVLAGDNEIATQADSDDRALSELLKEIMGDDPTRLLGTGYDAQQLAALAMVTRNESEIADFDAAAHWTGMPGYEPGQRLMTLNIYFASKKKRDEFMRKAGLDPAKVRSFSDGDKWQTYWPEDERPSMRGMKVVA